MYVRHRNIREIRDNEVIAQAGSVRGKLEIGISLRLRLSILRRGQMSMKSIPWQCPLRSAHAR
jgi:hypothetical protein